MSHNPEYSIVKCYIQNNRLKVTSLLYQQLLLSDILQYFNTTASPSDCYVAYPKQSLKSYLSSVLAKNDVPHAPILQGYNPHHHIPQWLIKKSRLKGFLPSVLAIKGVRYTPITFLSG